MFREAYRGQVGFNFDMAHQRRVRALVTLAADGLGGADVNARDQARKGELRTLSADLATNRLIAAPSAGLPLSISTLLLHPHRPLRCLPLSGQDGCTPLLRYLRTGPGGSEGPWMAEAMIAHLIKLGADAKLTAKVLCCWGRSLPLSCPPQRQRALHRTRRGNLSDL